MSQPNLKIRFYVSYSEQIVGTGHGDRQTDGRTGATLYAVPGE